MKIFIISNASFYDKISPIKEYENDKMFLIDTIKHVQDLYEKNL